AASFQGGDLPSAAASQIAQGERSPPRPTGATTYATQHPSGETAGCDGTAPSTTSSAVSSGASSLMQRAFPANICTFSSGEPATGVCQVKLFYSPCHSGLWLVEASSSQVRLR